MKKKLIPIFGITLMSFWFSVAQVGIGTIAPEASAALDVSSANSGFLAPRVSLSDVSDGTSPIDTPATGLLIFNTNASVTGGSGTGYYYWSGSQWSQLITNASVGQWGTSGNTGTDPSTDFIGTTDAQDLAIRTNNVQRMVVDANGNVGIGEANPSNTLDVAGSILFDGDFVNQQALAVHGDAVQNVPFTNSQFTPLTGTTVSITITDGSGVNNSAVFISGFARVFGGSLNGTNSSVGGYFMVLQRDTDPSFATAVNLTYTAGVCYLETPNGLTSAAVPFGGGGHISYLETGLTAGTTYYYRLNFYTNGVGITSGTYDIYQRDLNVIQIKQ
ncbi:hypothetical protein [Gilvibacter sediminis]|uniref:hypothetical protein n=1 Tax=Gilvibacter sediminis TaxID=379071 RepID=UPI0023501567|nr:hypothetical protein [Gilvibacter sediminis]MDC7996553.1 hypothetical protein [Gilvibacter sediminis]